VADENRVQSNEATLMTRIKRRQSASDRVERNQKTMQMTSLESNMVNDEVEMVQVAALSGRSIERNKVANFELGSRSAKVQRVTGSE
jgi:hypothetical protein